MTANPAPAASAAVPAAEAAGIYKQFGSTQALRGVDLTLWPGRCLGLVGRNGAGKSTLVSILSGIYPADRGEVRFDGAAAPALGAVGAWRRQIATVFQHSMVVPAPDRRGERVPGAAAAAGRAGGLAADARPRRRRSCPTGASPIDVNLACADLTVEQRQIVEIARALASGTRCLLLDEPTAALERAASNGSSPGSGSSPPAASRSCTSRIISRKSSRSARTSPSIRDGELVLTGAAAGLSKDQLVSAMVGPDVAATRADLAPRVRACRSPAGLPPGNPAWSSIMCRPARPAAGSPTSHWRSGPGERVGVTGLLSAGVATLARIVAGAARYETGRVLVAGTEPTAGRRDLDLKAGVGYIPEDRQAEGFVAALSVAENATMTITDWLARVAGFLRPSARAAAAAPLARRLSIVSAGLGQISGELSGGNQQKVTVARALAREPRLIVAITPTRGVDVASKSLLLAELARVTDETGAGLLLASDELDDLVICDRVIVLVRGERFTEFSEPPFDREALIAASEGMARGHEAPICRPIPIQRATMSETPNAPGTAVLTGAGRRWRRSSRGAVAARSPSRCYAKRRCSPSLPS